MQREDRGQGRTTWTDKTTEHFKDMHKNNSQTEVHNNFEKALVGVCAQQIKEHTTLKVMPVWVD